MDRIKRLREKAMRLPLSPGVYIMKNKDGQIIYIGKAKALKNRVSQYFGSENGHSIKVRKMVENVSDFDYILVGSEFEALVLECSLIKRHNPKYNILLKDDKGYCYIRVTRGDWRTISLSLQKYDDGAEYDENLKRRRRCLFLQPGGRDADGIGDVKGRTDTGICIYGVEKSDKGSQRVVPWKLRRPEILTAGEKNVDCHGNHLG